MIKVNKDYKISKYFWTKKISSKNFSKYNNEKSILIKTEDFLRKAVHRQIVSDVPVGTFLSGGVDSSLITIFAKEKIKNLISFSIDVEGQSQDGFEDDLPYAKRVAEKLDIPLEIINVDSDLIIKSIKNMVWQLDEPLADPAALNVFFISKLARHKGIKVMLSGTGGDDIFTGYRRHIAVEKEALWSWLPIRTRKKIKRIAEFLPSGYPLGRRIKKAFSGADLNSTSRLINYFKWINRDDLKKLYSKEFLSEIINYDEEKVMRDFLEKFPNDLDNLQKILKLEQRFFLADHNLIYNDKMSMQTGVEVRVPFLDKELTNFAENIPSKIKQKRNQSKWILKKIMEKYLPKDIVYRSKSGFGVPLRKWIKYDLDEWLQEVLSEKKLKENGIFNPTTVQELIKK